MTRVAYQGAPGAFSWQACRAFLPEAEPVAKLTFPEVTRAVIDGEVDLGMLPRENSIAGPVPGMKELIEQSGLVVRGRVNLQIRMHLLARPGVALEEIAVAVSHPVALAQCAETLGRLNIATEPCDNTAFAAQAVARSTERWRAAIGSEEAAEANGLTIVRRDVHDRPDNVTTLFVVAREGWVGR